MLLGVKTPVSAPKSGMVRTPRENKIVARYLFMSDSWDILPIAAGSVVFGDGFTASGLRWKTLGDDLLFHHFVTLPRGTFNQRVYSRSVNPAIWPGDLRGVGIDVFVCVKPVGLYEILHPGGKRAGSD